MILNRPKVYYENDKERLTEQAKGRYRNLSEEDQNKKKKNMGKTDTIICLKRKKRLKEYQKKLSRGKKASI